MNNPPTAPSIIKQEGRERGNFYGGDMLLLESISSLSGLLSPSYYFISKQLRAVVVAVRSWQESRWPKGTCRHSWEGQRAILEGEM